jgi:uncharacterized membrane protein YfcA
MVFGSFIAGASSEGGGAIAFPVMTLALDIAPHVARNFSLAIQSVGMTAASLYIIGSKIKIENKAVIWGSVGGVIGIFISSLFLAGFFSPVHLKLFFVSLWLAFGYALFRINNSHSLMTHDELPVTSTLDIAKLIAFGLIGGMVTGLIGNGIDILLFCLLTLHYGISEKVSTPTSVVLMTINTITGMLIHTFVIKDFGIGTEAFNYWIACIPIVVFGAPLGAWFISKLDRHVIAIILYTIIVVQFITAIVVMYVRNQMTLPMWLFSGLILSLGLLLFQQLSKKRRKAANLL